MATDKERPVGIEIERKFLVADDAWRDEVVRSEELWQGYLSQTTERVVRVRMIDDLDAFLAVKGQRVGDRRPEFEYRIPPGDATFMLAHLCAQPLIGKVRHHLSRSPGEWIVDEFLLDNSGLVLAEAEYADSSEITDLPNWTAREVTRDDRYANSRLQANPYCRWPLSDRRYKS